jgi:signal peptidase I
MKHWLKENRWFVAFLFCFGFFRLAIADWNPIPSGSMRPTLLEGDVVLVDRLAYDFKLPLSDIAVVETGEPRRGDVVTFTSPRDGVRLIKRLVALPGDVVEIRNEVLYINGAAAEYLDPALVAEPLAGGATTAAIRATERAAGSERTVQFLPDVSAGRSFGPVAVPPGNYFFLGDNRDNSADSRFIGFVPRRLLIGRAHHILVSANITGNWMPRLDRVGERIR